MHRGPSRAAASWLAEWCSPGERLSPEVGTDLLQCLAGLCSPGAMQALRRAGQGDWAVGRCEAYGGTWDLMDLTALHDPTPVI